MTSAALALPCTRRRRARCSVAVTMTSHACQSRCCSYSERNTACARSITRLRFLCFCRLFCRRRVWLMRTQLLRSDAHLLAFRQTAFPFCFAFVRLINRKRLKALLARVSRRMPSCASVVQPSPSQSRVIKSKLKSHFHSNSALFRRCFDPRANIRVYKSMLSRDGRRLGGRRAPDGIE